VEQLLDRRWRSGAARRAAHDDKKAQVVRPDPAGVAAMHDSPPQGICFFSQQLFIIIVNYIVSHASVGDSCFWHPTRNGHPLAAWHKLKYTSGARWLKSWFRATDFPLGASKETMSAQRLLACAARQQRGPADCRLIL